MIVYKLGKYFWHPINLEPDSQRVVYSTTHEQEPPYRIGLSIVLRIWGHRGVVIGRWDGYHDDEDSALMAGLDAHEDTLLDESGGLAQRFHRQAARRTVAAATQDIDEEWTVINALDLME
jgi:hypothetical protein